MASFDFTLPAKQSDRPMDWEGASFETDFAIVQGNSHLGMQWGGPKTDSKGILEISDPVKQDDGSFVITITLREPEPVIDMEALAFVSRYNLAHGFYGVICTMLQEARPAIPS
jgi:hypothetical protein